MFQMKLFEIYFAIYKRLKADLLIRVKFNVERITFSIRFIYRIQVSAYFVCACIIDLSS